MSMVGCISRPTKQTQAQGSTVASNHTDLVKCGQSRNGFKEEIS